MTLLVFSYVAKIWKCVGTSIEIVLWCTAISCTTYINYLTNWFGDGAVNQIKCHSTAIKYTVNSLIVDRKILGIIHVVCINCACILNILYKTTRKKSVSIHRPLVNSMHKHIRKRRKTIYELVIDYFFMVSWIRRRCCHRCCCCCCRHTY